MHSVNCVDSVLLRNTNFYILYHGFIADEEEEEGEEEEEEEKEEEEEEGVYWGRGPRRLSPRISPQATKNERDLIPPNKTRGIIMNGDGDDRNSEVSTSFGEDDEEEEIEGDGPGWYFGGE